MEPHNIVNIALDNGLLPHGTKALPGPALTNDWSDIYLRFNL